MGLLTKDYWTDEDDAYVIFMSLSSTSTVSSIAAGGANWIALPLADWAWAELKADASVCSEEDVGEGSPPEAVPPQAKSNSITTASGISSLVRYDFFPPYPSRFQYYCA